METLYEQIEWHIKALKDDEARLRDESESAHIRAEVIQDVRMKVETLLNRYDDEQKKEENERFNRIATITQ